MDRPSANPLNTPPVLPALGLISVKRQTWLLRGMAALLVVVVLQNVALPSLPCGFKTITGMACPLCGGTRAATSLANLDFINAFSFNPLAAVSLLMATAGIVWGCVTPSAWERVQTVLSQRFSRRQITLGLLIVVLLNWAYLLWVGR